MKLSLKEIETIMVLVERIAAYSEDYGYYSRSESAEALTKRNKAYDELVEYLKKLDN